MDVLGVSLPFFATIFLGFLSGKLARLPRTGLAWLDFFLVYISLPAMLFYLIARMPTEQLAHWPFVIGTTASSLIAYGLTFGLARLVSRGNKKVTIFQALLGSYSNSGYMGTPLAIGVLGAAAAAPAALIVCFDVSFFFAITPVLYTLFSGEGRVADSLKKAGRRVITHPFILSSAAGFAFALLKIPVTGQFEAILVLLKGAATPAALFALGVTVALSPVGLMGREMPVILFVKLLIHPVLEWAMVMLIAPDLPKVWLHTAILIGALPPAATIFVLTQGFNTYVERASTTILIGTALSVATVTAVIYLLAGGFVPGGM